MLYANLCFQSQGHPSEELQKGITGYDVVIAPCRLLPNFQTNESPNPGLLFPVPQRPWVLSISYTSSLLMEWSLHWSLSV